ncbi:MAG: dienelactone hydrolase family protein [Myxococcales bacterium]|nr:dienelactone hydrolase family protein [Myxococcales bacterium]
MTSTEKITWTIDEAIFEGHAVWRGDANPKPAVLVCHTWGGQKDFERSRAAHLAELGYVGIAIDVYGKGCIGDDKETCRALMEPLMADREKLRRRLHAAIEAARLHQAVDPRRVAVIGFCFGGLCALDVARGGLDVLGVVAFHGLLQPSGLASRKVKAKVLALHGYDDPMAPPSALTAFANEMTTAGADWQVHAYGGTMHAFTNPIANDPSFGTVYNPIAERRSRAAMEQFLGEIFGSTD